MESFVRLSTGVRMEYVEQGHGDGIPVILLHGVTDSWRSFERLLPLLPPHVHAFAISQRGHGSSSRPDEGYRLSDMSRDLRAFMDAAGLPSAVIVGHSMGAMVAQRFVVDHLDRVAGLVLMGAVSTLSENPDWTAFYQSTIAPLTDPIGATFVREWQQRTLARPMLTDHRDVIVRETLKVPARVWQATFEGLLSTPDFSAALATAAVPTLILWGDRDAYADRASQERLRTVIRGARLVVYGGAGHAFHWEDPIRCAKDIGTFLETTVGTRELAISR